MSYTNVFGGNTIYPSDVSYLSITLSANTPLEWPLESSGTEPPAARIIDVDPTAANYSIILPNATLTGAGQTILFNNIDVAHSFYIKDFAGNTLATVAAGTQWQVYLAATTTAGGTWRVFRYGASTATVQPSDLDGFGLTVTGSTLSQSVPVLTYSSSPVAVPTSGRASAFVWTGTGAGTFTLPPVGDVGNNFFVAVRNSGGGNLTLDPTSSETIDDAQTLTLRPGDSSTLITDGTSWYTIGLGQEAVFAFDYTVISLTPGTTTLAGAQLNRIAYRFEGNLTGGNCTVIVPSTIQQYWITNATTGTGLLFVRTSGGAPTQVNRNAKGIYYCDGTEMVLASDPTSLTTPIVITDGGTGANNADQARTNLGISSFADPLVRAANAASARTILVAAASGANNDITSLTGLTTPVPVASGGTGLTSYAVGDLLYASTTTALSRLADVATGNSLISGGVGVAPTWGKIGLTTHVSGTLGVGNGGTGASTSTGTGSVVLATSPALVTPDLGIPSAGTLTNATGLPIDGGTINTLPVTRGGTGATTATAAVTGLGATAIGSALFTLTNSGVNRFLQLNADNSVSALTDTAFRTAIGAGSGGGSVTSVSFTGGIVSVTDPSAAAALTVAGTSGGIPYFSSGTTWATSAALAANALVVGGGAGAAPATVTTGTGVLTALGVAVGTNGAFVTFNGALGTPSGGSLDNCTFPTLNQNTSGSAATFTSTTQNSQFNSIGVGTPASNTGGEIRATNNVTAFFSSDARLKENVQPIGGALDIVTAVGGKTFDWTDEYVAEHGGADGYFVRKEDFGVIAQDVEAAFPMAVRTREDGTKAVDYAKLVAVAFQAIADLRAEVEALKK